MFWIPRRYSHFVFGVIPAGLTSFVASFPSIEHWLVTWLISWVVMILVVLLAAPVVRSLALALTGE